MPEIWKQVVGHSNYEVSSEGRVRSAPRQGAKGGVLSLRKNSHGYLFVGLYKDGVPKIHSVHRLVAIAFIPNPKNKPQVNHIDCNKLNNLPENLEHTTAKENIAHARINGIYDDEKKVLQFKDGIVIEEWPSSMEAGRRGFDQGAISRCCNKKSKTHAGFQWQFAPNF